MLWDRIKLGALEVALWVVMAPLMPFYLLNVMCEGLAGFLTERVPRWRMTLWCLAMADVIEALKHEINKRRSLPPD